MSKIYFPRVRSSGGLRAHLKPPLPLYLSLSRRFLPLIWSKFISKQARPIIYAPFARAQWTQQRRNAFFLRVCINKKILMAPFLLPFQQ